MGETWLSHDEVEELTTKKRFAAQRRALTAMGIPYLPNAAGRPLVERSVVLKGPKPERARKKTEPDLSVLQRLKKKP